ncbi:alpha/beta hydrolase [Aquihabitans daechungensis]|uniref:alpha/beta hydrolase n=1 Tax=Aquihabitans daechungensis TaxID=1052257 RepID=UPI003BA1502F
MNPTGTIPRTTAQRAVLQELHGFAELPRLIGRMPRLARKPRGAGTPVLVLPGRGVDDLSTLPLRGYLRLIGYAPAGWMLGLNDGDLGRLVPLAADRAAYLSAAAGRPIPIVGQSMGGSIAREVARRRPDVVSRVITLGSPIMSARSREPITRPLTVIYSKADQIVPPHWALAKGDEAEVVEVGSTHFSMGIDPDVWAIVADRLAAPDEV